MLTPNPKHPLLQVNWYAVLGNHDYGNGIDPMANGGCAATTLEQCPKDCCYSPVWQVGGGGVSWHIAVCVGCAVFCLLNMMQQQQQHVCVAAKGVVILLLLMLLGCVLCSTRGPPTMCAGTAATAPTRCPPAATGCWTLLWWTPTPS